MPKRLLQLVLALTLILNGILAPWAMAGMLGGHHGMGHTAPNDAAADSHAHHGHHLDHEQAPHQEPSTLADADHCCDGAICQCGCVLPPALSVAVIELAPPALLALQVQRQRSQLTAHHPTPLLRPPAA